MQILLLFSCLLFISQSKKSTLANRLRLKQKQKSKHRHKSQVTPKAQYLHDVYDYNSLSNGYGPFPTLSRQTELSISSLGDIDMVDEERVIHCDSEHQEYLAFCLRIRDCDICASSQRCGWCMMRGVCLPKQSKKYKICNQEMCRTGLFIENISQCGSTKVFGQIDANVAQEVEGVIKPLVAKKIYKVNTIYTHPAVVNTPVLLGVEYEDHDKEWKDINNNSLVKKQQIISKKPIYGEIKQVRNVNTFKQDIVDEKGFKVVQDDSKTTHGYDID